MNLRTISGLIITVCSQLQIGFTYSSISHLFPLLAYELFIREYSSKLVDICLNSMFNWSLSANSVQGYGLWSQRLYAKWISVAHSLINLPGFSLSLSFSPMTSLAISYRSQIFPSINNTGVNGSQSLSSW